MLNYPPQKIRNVVTIDVLLSGRLDASAHKEERGASNGDLDELVPESGGGYVASATGERQ